MAMVAHHASGAEPLMVRGKPAHAQYSNRQTIVSNPRDNPSRVLLVTMDDSASQIVSVDMLHALFSAFGSVQKIATFEKGSGFQALVQFDQAVTANNARASLDGRPIPQYLLGMNPPITMRINFSSHDDIVVNFQSHKSRDYTNPNLPVAANATNLPQAATAPILGPTSYQNNREGNILLAVVDNAAYPLTVEPLHTVFSKYGAVEKIAIFEKNNAWQALVQYGDIESANNAKLALEGHAIFEGGYNKLRLAASMHKDLTIRENNERTWDYTGGRPTAATEDGRRQQNEPIITGVDFEQAHENVVKMAQTAMMSGGRGAAGAMAPQPQMMLQPQGMYGSMPMDGFAGQQMAYPGAMQPMGMSPMPHGMRPPQMH